MKYLLLSLPFLLLMNSCKTKVTGCMDPLASNYDPLAERYGECIYEEPAPPPNPEPTEEYGKVRLKVSAFANDNVFYLEENYKDDKNRNFQFKIFKFYMSNIKLTDRTTKSLISDVELIDFDTTASISPNCPKGSNYFEADSVVVGSFNELFIGFGVDPERNEEYLNNAYPNTHPLNTTCNDMGWGWRDKYKFTMVEGRLDTDSNAAYDQDMFWHTGFSDLYRFRTIPAQGIKVMKGQTTFIHLKLDVLKLFEGLEISGKEGKTHTGTPEDKISAEIFQTNLSRAVSLEGVTYE